MHQDQHLAQKRLLRDLKGSPLSIIIALIISQKALTNQDLQKWTGYKDKKSIKEGLERLAEYGVVKNLGRYKGWTLADGINQLPLPFKTIGEGDFSPFVENRVIDLSTGEIHLSTEDDDLSTNEGDFFPLPLIKKETYSYSSNSGNPSLLNSPNAEKGENPPSKYPDVDREPDDEILKICRELRILPPASMWLAGWSWVTREYLIAHVEKVKDEKQQIGLAIYRIAKQLPQPPSTNCPKCGTVNGWRVEDQVCLFCSGVIRG